MLGFVLQAAWYVVGVVLYVGAVENRILGEGIHFIIPFAEQVVQLEVRTLKFQADATAALQ